MLASVERLCAFVEAHAGDGQPAPAGFQFVLGRARALLSTHAADLREHISRLGGTCAPAPGARLSRVPPSAKTIADLFSQISLVHAAALMLETNARALGFSSTAALAARHREETSVLLAALRELLPQAA